ncbi:hypothetical protein LXL04_022030 [Taraxacum kok-saghyz]
MGSRYRHFQPPSPQVHHRRPSLKIGTRIMLCSGDLFSYHNKYYRRHATNQLLPAVANDDCCGGYHVLRSSLRTTVACPMKTSNGDDRRRQANNRLHFHFNWDYEVLTRIRRHAAITQFIHSKETESGKRVVMSAKITKEMDAYRVTRYCVSSATVSASLPHRLLQSLVGLAILGVIADCQDTIKTAPDAHGFINYFGMQVFVRKVIELHDKYLAYVNDCFINHTLFHKACMEMVMPMSSKRDSSMFPEWEYNSTYVEDCWNEIISLYIFIFLVVGIVLRFDFPDPQPPPATLTMVTGGGALVNCLVTQRNVVHCVRFSEHLSLHHLESWSDSYDLFSTASKATIFTVAQVSCGLSSLSFTL